MNFSKVCPPETVTHQRVGEPRTEEETSGSTALRAGAFEGAAATVHLRCDCAPVAPGDRAFCGAALHGVPLPTGTAVDCVVCADMVGTRGCLRCGA